MTRHTALAWWLQEQRRWGYPQRQLPCWRAADDDSEPETDRPGHWRERGHGRIVNVSSMLAQVNVPFTGWYGAAKAALDSLGGALRLELAPSGVSVISIECGAIATDVWDDAGAAVTEGDDESTAQARHRWVELTDAVSSFYPDPEAVGQVIADAAMDRRPRRVYRVGFGSRPGVLSDVVPKAVEDRVAAVLFCLGR